MSVRTVMHSSETNEWYTPRHITDAAREVMGEIELDPASCWEANALVRARRIYTADDDGLRQPWDAKTLWLNPPYGKSDDDNTSNQARWSAKLANEVRALRVEQACILVNAMPGNRWFEPLWQHAVCFLRGRVRFVAPNGSGPKNSPTHSSVVVYLGWQHERFAAVFGRLGHVVLPSQVVALSAQGALL